MKDIKIRAVSGSLYAATLIVAIFFSPFTMSAVIFIFSSLALWEFQRLIQFKSIIPFITLLLSIGYALFGLMTRQTEDMMLYTALALNSALITLLFSSKKINYNYPMKLILSIGYLVFSSYFICKSAYEGLTYSPWLLTLLYLSIWVNNSFAYIFGSKFGKHKLHPKISPKKSWEGFFGGMIATILLTYIIEEELNLFENKLWILFAFMVPILATLGDFIQSYFKRIAEVKDSGSLIPGHGGFYDRMDSVIFVAPYYYLLLKFI
ncbi:MAG: phosphatidate cytidylyltransferase [Flavobacteriaceae bacterium]|nr:phosphatidate cytidylyltransferase [Flavobacteriaceae bacterium]